MFISENILENKDNIRTELEIILFIIFLAQNLFDLKNYSFKII